MRDYFHVNILNEGMIPWIMEKGPLFGYYTAAGVYDLLARDPRVKIEITTAELAEKRRSEYMEKKRAAAAPKKDTLKVEDKVEIKVESKVPVSALTNEAVQNDEHDDEIDAVLENTDFKMMDVDIANAPKQQLDADGHAVYTDEEINKMTKKELKTILETRGHASGQRFVKTDDPFSPMYHDSVEELREKVRKSQETF